MAEIGIYDSQGSHVAGSKIGGKMAKEGFFAGLKFYADVQGSNVSYHCFFRGKPTSSSRAEQYFAEYKGETVGFKELSRKIKSAMESEFGQSFEFAKTEDDFLFDLVGVKENNFGYSADKIQRKLRKNQQIEFIAGGNSEAASLVDFLMDIETQSRDRHATIGVAKNFRKIKEPEVAVKTDDSARKVQSPTLDQEPDQRSKNSSQQTQEDWTPPGKDKPSGPVEWVKSLF